MRWTLIVTIFMCFITLTNSLSATTIETREYLLGDIDDFHYDGLGSVDDVYVNPDWLLWVENKTIQPIHGFDSISADHQIPFTFEYHLEADEIIIGATILFKLQSPGAPATTDMIHLDQTGQYYSFEELGWLPIPTYESDMRSLDLSDVAGDNLLGFLQDGELNVLIHDDTCIDYARLTLTVIPEPLSSVLFVIGLTYMRRK